MEALRHASLRRYRAGDVVIREGARSREVYVVRGGKLKVSQGARHEEHSMTLLPGDIVGEIGALHHVPRTATVKAERDSELFRIDDKTFDLLLRSSPEFRHVMEATAHVRRLGLD
ncbi:MAG: hypothetical protein A2506_07975 [Elusimicrobia bacterium RIFOXYD12_FULL_66_9]|nr:MAG: hypothetical protein A2506_07975 [Elusimicrobia bacterium RIFOXYD12_FULL_66_9]